MRTWKFKGLLQKSGWISPAYVAVDEDGIISKISHEPLKATQMNQEGWAFPGVPNAHSHAFQYAMAGTSEIPSPNQNDHFWSWREKMYALATQLNPDEIEAIATVLYREMLRVGYTSVAEFQYLHHDVDGAPYENPAEISQRLASAAYKAGIRITLVPIYYKQGGFGKEASPHQRRFLHSNVDAYLKLVSHVAALSMEYEHVGYGVGVHSLRAATLEDLRLVFSSSSGVPKHVHISEQRQEVDEAVSFLGKRPVDCLLEEGLIDCNTHLVHATHMTDAEVEGVAKAGGNIVLCPSTEGNLGDGFFPLRSYMAYGGRWCLGSDSHTTLDPMEELRWLDYGQRLQSEKRCTFDPYRGLEQVVLNGRSALGSESSDYFEVGKALDAFTVGDDHPLIHESSSVHLLSTLIHNVGSRNLMGTIMRGRYVQFDEVNRDLSNRFTKARSLVLVS